NRPGRAAARRGAVGRTSPARPSYTSPAVHDWKSRPRGCGCSSLLPLMLADNEAHGLGFNLLQLLHQRGAFVAVHEGQAVGDGLLSVYRFVACGPCIGHAVCFVVVVALGPNCLQMVIRETVPRALRSRRTRRLAVSPGTRPMLSSTSGSQSATFHSYND